MRAAAAACLAIAGLSLVLPLEPGFDAWGWLVRGRQLLHFDLDTAGAPAWKPLPVLVTAALSIFGGAAPELWLLVVRVAWLLTPVLAYRLGARLGGRVAGGVAAVGVVLMPGFASDFARGSSEPLLVALTLLAVELHLDGRAARALVVLFLMGLIRPEAWPILGACALLVWRREPGRRRMVAALAVAVPLLWFGADWIGSGDALTGVERATVLDPKPFRALGRVPTLVILPVWVAAVAAVVLALRRRPPPARRWAAAPGDSHRFGSRPLAVGDEGADVAVLQGVLTEAGFATPADGRFGELTKRSVERFQTRERVPVDGEVSGRQAVAMTTAIGRGEDRDATLLLAALAAAWIAAVLALALLEFAGLHRFMFPAGALLCVVGGIGASRLVTAGRAGVTRRRLSILLACVAAPFVALGAVGFVRDHGHAVDVSRGDRDLATAVRVAGGPEPLLACGTVATVHVLNPHLAYELDVPLVRVDAITESLVTNTDRGVFLARGRAAELVERSLLGQREGQLVGDRSPRAGADGRPKAQRLLGSGEIAVFAVGCASAR